MLKRLMFSLKTALKQLLSAQSHTIRTFRGFCDILCLTQEELASKQAWSEGGAGVRTATAAKKLAEIDAPE
jgi:hypothetical protein